MLVIDGIELEAPLEGTILITRNRDVPGVIGKIGTALGNLGVNIATFSLGRSKPEQGADAIALVRLDGKVDDGIIAKIREIPSITDARLVRLPETTKAQTESSLVRDGRVAALAATNGRREVAPPYAAHLPRPSVAIGIRRVPPPVVCSPRAARACGVMAIVRRRWEAVALETPDSR